ncbi:MAG: heavy-metal-associated domain-containing protein [Ignavibacteriaceae bacterium]
MKTEELKIEGMTCNHCVMAVKKELETLQNIIVEKADIGSAKVQYDDTKISRDDLAKAIDKAGYKLLS